MQSLYLNYHLEICHLHRIGNTIVKVAYDANGALDYAPKRVIRRENDMDPMEFRVSADTDCRWAFGALPQWKIYSRPRHYSSAHCRGSSTKETERLGRHNFSNVRPKSYKWSRDRFIVRWVNTVINK
jgi:hypothetical protein